MTKAEFLERPPESASVTDYDRQHMTLYLRLLDAASDGAAWEEAVLILFGIDPTAEPERARRVHDSYVAFRDRNAAWSSIGLRAVLEARVG